MYRTTFQRNTRQRRVIMEELQELKSHPTAQELHDIVRRRLPKISLSTIYRNLDALVQQGAILKLDSSGAQSRFDGNSAPHCHVLCTSCGKIYDVQSPPAELVDKHMESLDGFVVHSWRLEYQVTCPACRDKQESALPGN